MNIEDYVGKTVARTIQRVVIAGSIFAASASLTVLSSYLTGCTSTGKTKVENRSGPAGDAPEGPTSTAVTSATPDSATSSAVPALPFSPETPSVTAKTEETPEEPAPFAAATVTTPTSSFESRIRRASPIAVSLEAIPYRIATSKLHVTEPTPLTAGANPGEIIRWTVQNKVDWLNSYRNLNAAVDTLRREAANTNETALERYTQIRNAFRVLQNGVNENNKRQVSNSLTLAREIDGLGRELAAASSTANGLKQQYESLSENFERTFHLATGTASVVYDSVNGNVALARSLDVLSDSIGDEQKTNASQQKTIDELARQIAENPTAAAVLVYHAEKGNEKLYADIKALSEKFTAYQQQRALDVATQTAEIAGLRAAVQGVISRSRAPATAPAAPTSPAVSVPVPSGAPIRARTDEFNTLLQDAREAYWLGNLPESSYNQLKREVNKGTSPAELRHIYLNRRD